MVEFKLAGKLRNGCHHGLEKQPGSAFEDRLVSEFLVHQKHRGKLVFKADAQEVPHPGRK